MRRFFPFVIVCLITVPRILNQSYILIALPIFLNTLDLSSLQIQFFYPSNLLGTLLFLLPAGLLGDRYGPRKLLIWTTYAFVILSTLAAFSQSGNGLIILLFLLGISTAFSMTQAPTYLSDIYPLEYRGRVIGIFSGLVSVSFYIGPVLGGLVTQFGQMGVFLTNLPFLVLGILFSCLLPCVHKEPKKEAKIEYKRFCDISFVSNCLIAFFWQGIIALLIFFPAEFQIYLGLSPFESGLRFAFLLLPFPLFSPLAGWVFDKYGCRIPYIIGYTALFSSLIFSFFGFNSLALSIVAFSLAFVLPTSAAASWGLFEQNHRSTANSIYYFLRFVGGISTTFIASHILLYENTHVDFLFLNFSIATAFGVLSLPALFYALKTPLKKHSMS